MRIQILSDLHLDIWGDTAPGYDMSISQPDLVVLAGDIHKGDKAIAWAARQFAGIPVLYVHGNHEAYGLCLEDMQADIALACSKTSNVHFLHGSEFQLAGVRFLGASLWTDFCLFGESERPYAMLAAADVMADYRRIRLAGDGQRQLQPADTALIHARQKAWLSKELDKEFAGPTVVISHMAPSMQSVAPMYAKELSSAAFASNLEELAAKADLWIHGHMHDSFDYQLGKCRVICNPCGYPLGRGETENPFFDGNLVISI